MKTNQINKLLQGVYNDFLEHISNESIKDIFKDKSFVTGGCIPSMAMDEFVNDYDIYLFDKKSVDAVKSYFQNVHQQEKQPVEIAVKPKYKVNLITENAINLSDKIQIITKYYGEPIDVVGSFDFQHIKSWFRFNSEIIFCDEFYRLIHEKELVYTGSEYPLSSFFRVKKYIKKGWNVSNATMLHIALDIVSAFNKNKIILYDNEKMPDLVWQDEETKLEFYKEYVNNREEQEEEFDVETIIQQLNGVDPITIQAELNAYLGKRLSINEIINLIN